VVTALIDEVDLGKSSGATFTRDESRVNAADVRGCVLVSSCRLHEVTVRGLRALSLEVSHDEPVLDLWPDPVRPLVRLAILSGILC